RGRFQPVSNHHRVPCVILNTKIDSSSIGKSAAQYLSGSARVSPGRPVGCSPGHLTRVVPGSRRLATWTTTLDRAPSWSAADQRTLVVYLGSQLAFACFQGTASQTCFTLGALNVITLRDGRIAEMTGVLDPRQKGADKTR